MALLPGSRIRRLLGTRQGRLPQELRLRGIRTVPAANRFLQRIWVPTHHRTWTVPAAQAGTAFVPCHRPDLDRIFALQRERVVGADHTVQFGTVCFQLKRAPWRISFAKCRVTVYVHLDGRIAVGSGPYVLGWHRAVGPRNLTTCHSRPDRSRTTKPGHLHVLLTAASL